MLKHISYWVSEIVFKGNHYLITRHGLNNLYHFRFPPYNFFGEVVLLAMLSTTTSDNVPNLSFLFLCDSCFQSHIANVKCWINHDRKNQTKILFFFRRMNLFEFIETRVQ